MSRWTLMLALCSACGDNLKPDVLPDAEADAFVVDTLVCATGEAACEGECIGVATDETNCGACANVCHGGEVCKNAECKCPVGIVPSLVFPTGFEQFFPVGGFVLTLAPTLSLSGVNGLVFGTSASIALNTDIDLASVPLGTPPFVGSLAGLDVQGLMVDATYLATAGTIRFTKRCDTEIEGTLTNATFNGISGGLLGGGIPMIDPEGCVIQVPTLNFHLATAACP
jgi:hypothetical protein